MAALEKTSWIPIDLEEVMSRPSVEVQIESELESLAVTQRLAKPVKAATAVFVDLGDVTVEFFAFQLLFPDASSAYSDCITGEGWMV